MTDLPFAILFILLFLFATYLGFTIGSWAGERAVTKREYWLYNIAAIAGTALAIGLFAWPAMLYAIPFGFLPGAIAGLKMGFGESTGPWRLLDRFYNVNRSHRETAARGGGEARRARKRAGEKAPDLISVQDGSKQADMRSHRRKKG